MVSRLAISTTAALISLGVTAANAADLAPVIVPQQEFASSWYLRGDIGFSNQDVGSLTNAADALYSQVINTDKSFDSAPFFVLGIGYNFNNWLRFDVTGEYRGKANFHGYDRAYDGITWFDDNYSGSKSEWTFLFNGYVDLGTWNCVTPFVGAGVGFSRNTISSFRDIGQGTATDVYGDTASKWNFAWALYAGLGYQVTKNATLEIAYRYLDLGDATTGNMHNPGGTPDPSYTPFSFNHLTSQDIMLGFRWGCCEIAPPPPPPLRSRG
jgi:opacity protein-like surface antigen